MTLQLLMAATDTHTYTHTFTHTGWTVYSLSSIGAKRRQKNDFSYFERKQLERKASATLRVSSAAEDEPTLAASRVTRLTNTTLETCNFPPTKGGQQSEGGGIKVGSGDDQHSVNSQQTNIFHSV